MRLRTLSLLSLLCLPAACSLWATPSNDNVLVIVVDGLRFDAISRSLGAARTPHLQRLAEEGVAFTSCFSHSSATQPAHAAIFSGCLPQASGVVVDESDVAQNVPLLPEHLAASGYTTFGVLSEWKRWFKSPDQPAKRATKSLDRGFASLRVPADEPSNAREVTDAFLSLFGSVPSDAPWFAFVEFSDTEAPYDSHGSAEVTADVALDGDLLDKLVISEAPLWKREVELVPGTHRFLMRSTEPFKLARFRCDYSKGSLPLIYEVGTADQPSKVFVVAVENPGPTPITCSITARMHDCPDPKATRARYKLEVETIDGAVGEILQALKERGAYDQTCVVLTSGHGESLGEHAEASAFANLYDESLRVPLIVKPPKNSAARVELIKAQNTLVRHVDLAPTLLEMLDERAFENIEGSSLLERAERLHVAEVHPPQAKDSAFALRDDRYKMIYTPAEDRFEMYDSLRDTLELENIFMVQGHVRQAWQKKLRQLARSVLSDQRVGMVAPHAADSPN